MGKFYEELDKLLKERLAITQSLAKQMEIVKQAKAKSAQRELVIKLALQTRISQASPEIQKEKFSSVDKRRVVLESTYKNDEILGELKKVVKKAEEGLLWHETEDTLCKLKEKYLFKTIDIYLTYLENGQILEEVQEELDHVKDTMCENCTARL